MHLVYIFCLFQEPVQLNLRVLSMAQAGFWKQSTGIANPCVSGYHQGSLAQPSPAHSSDIQGDNVNHSMNRAKI